MEKNLIEKQEQLIKTYKLLTEAMPLLKTEDVIRMSFAYVFKGQAEQQAEEQKEQKIKSVGRTLDARVTALRELRVRAKISQEKASTGIGKGKTFVLRLETGKAPLDKQTETKLLNFYKKTEEEKE